MLQGDERARLAVERFYRTEEPGTEAVWATSTKAYVFVVTKRVEEREGGGAKVPVHRSERISWRVLLAYDKPRPNDPETRPRESFNAAFASLKTLFHEVY